MYANVIAVYGPGIDAVFMVGVDYDAMHDIRMARASWIKLPILGFFDRLVSDKGFDSSELMMRRLNIA